MSGIILIFVFGSLKLLSLPEHTQTHTHPHIDTQKDDIRYYPLPRFWTSTGFCPAGEIASKDMRQALLSDAVQLNLRYIAALPIGAVTHVRIHWLLELIDFVAYTQAGVPIYDFSTLDVFITKLDDLNLLPVIEFMANPGDVFINNPNRNEFFWEDFSFQLVKHYVNIFGPEKLLRWRFELWNEPDVKNYNRLNFTLEDYIIYATALRRGLESAGHRPQKSLHFPLRGPAGLFKAPTNHPLCWGILEYCNNNFSQCPLEVLTYHRKGNGTVEQLMSESTALLKDVFQRYPNLHHLSLANDEADPITGWSTARPMQADVRYAHALISIVFQHWSAMQRQKDLFAQLESLSHDNAFLSYHPHEFTQRTLLAHFRMNQTHPAAAYSQFIQKPVYAALALMAKLAPFAADVEQLQTDDDDVVMLLETISDSDNAASPLFFSWLILSPENNTAHNRSTTYNIEKQLPSFLGGNESLRYGFIVELLEQQRTDPSWVWQEYGQPAYPNATVREEMRRSQTPFLHSVGRLELLLQSNSLLQLPIDFRQPWILLLRVCSDLMPPLKAPLHLEATEITHGEVLLTWREAQQPSLNCLQSYEVWFKAKSNSPCKPSTWIQITKGWHVPFPSFQYAPDDKVVDGFYRVRAEDIFDQYSKYSQVLEYIDL